jgi:hypothetical protein
MFIVNISAQNSQYNHKNWYATPYSSAVAFTNGDGAGVMGLTIGRYFGQNNDMRIDLDGGYFFYGENRDVFSAAVLVTTEAPLNLGNSHRMFGSTSIGIGILSSSASSGSADGNFTDIMIPLKCRFGYYITDWFSIGSELSYNFNVSRFKQRSILSVGLVLGFRF